MKTYLFLILNFIFVGVFAQEKKLSTAEIEEFKTFVEEEIENIQTIDTEFKQEKHLSFLTSKIESKGKMFVNKQGFLKWEYLTPEKYSIIFKENYIFINDNGKKSEVNSNQEIFKELSDLISGSVSGKLLNNPKFDISYFQKEEFTLVKLKPIQKSLQKYIKQVELYFPENDASVDKVKLIEASKDYTIINFIHKKINVEIDSYIFDY